MPHGTLEVSAAEVFDAKEAADLFHSYHQSGDEYASAAGR
jgi:hypothetical protein